MADLNNIGEQPELFKLFVGQIPKDMDELNLRPYFEEFGHIVEISIIRDNITMMSKGCAFVTFSYEHAAQMAVDKLHDKVQLPNAINPLQVRFAETQVDRDNKLFIGMLPKTMVEQDLHDMFGIFGEIREVHVIRGPEGGAKGCAFVKFIEREAALAAIDSLNDTIPPNGTRPLVVKFADGKKPKEDPWSMYRHGGPLHHPLGHPQSRMMYPYGQQPLGMAHPGTAGGYAPYGSGGAPRYGYSQPAGPSSGYYPGQDGQDNKRSPVYAQDGLLSKSGAEGEFGGAGRGEAYDSGLDVLPPNSGGPLPTPPGHIPPFPVDSESSHVRPPEGPSGANLFIYHLPRDLTDADLATLFAPFGNVISAKVFVDKKTSDSKGFGFVSYDTLENANAAIEAMNGFQIGSKRLKVQHKRVAGGPHTAGMSHSPYGAMMHGGPPPHMHLGHPAGAAATYQQQQHAQPSAYSFRPAPMPLTTPPGVMMTSSPLMQQPQSYGGAQPGLSGGGYAPQMRGAGPPPVNMQPVQNRMQTQAGRGGGYSYPSFSASVPTYAPVGTPQGQQPLQQPMQQRPNMLMAGRPDSGYGGGLVSGGYSASDAQPHSPIGQPPQLGGAVTYMDGSGPKTLQSQAGGGNGYYGQY